MMRREETKLTQVHLKFIAKPSPAKEKLSFDCKLKSNLIIPASPLGAKPKVTNPKTGRKSRGGNLRMRPSKVFQLPTALRIETRPRTTPKVETDTAFAMYVSPSNCDFTNLKLKLNWFRQKTAMNLQLKIPPKIPFLGSIEQGPLLRKRVIVKQVWRKGLQKLKSPSPSSFSGLALLR